MKAFLAVGAGLLIAVVGFFGCAFSTRNRIIELDEQAKAKWADIDATLQRRLDLVPNLVNTVQGAGKYEGETLQKITESRNQMERIVKDLKETPREPQQAERLDRLNSELLGTMRAFTGIAAEAYPQLYQEAAGRMTLDQSMNILQGRLPVKHDRDRAVKLASAATTSFF